MHRFNRLRRIGSLALAAFLCACSGVRSSTGGSQSTAPAWFANAAKEDAQFLYFVGNTSATTESEARDLAVQQALYELSVYCGATLNTKSVSVEREKNGVQTQDVSLSVSVAGEDISIQQARTDKWTVQRTDDGRFNAFVRVKWPKAQFANVRAQQQARAERALALLLDAEKAADDFRVSDAKRLLTETRALLAGAQAQLPLDHPKYKTSGLVQQGADALRARLDQMGDTRQRIISVAVVCDQDGKQKACESRWVGTVRSLVAKSGFEVAAQGVSESAARAILDSQSPAPDRAMRTAGFVVAVKYDARHAGDEDGFVFARCGARGVVFDTDRKEILDVQEVTPKKGGHINLEGAIQKGCERAEKAMSTWIGRSMGALKGKK